MSVALPWWHDCIHTPFDLAESPLCTREVCVDEGFISQASFVTTGYFQSESERKDEPEEVKMARGS